VPVPHPAVKTALPPAIQTGARAYEGWRAFDPQEGHRSPRADAILDLVGPVEGAGLNVEAVSGSVYYPPIGVLARLLASLDRWLGMRVA